MTMVRHRELHARLTVDAHDALHEWCGEQGCTATAFIESLVGHLDTEPVIEIAAAARLLAASRRRR